MKISIVTVTLNEAEALRHALQSVENQHYQPLEHIVVDGNSTDETDSVVAAFPHVRMVKRKPTGVYDALNYGFELATGDILGFVHGNDALPDHDVLHRVAKEFADDPCLDFVYGDMRYVKPVSHRHVRVYYAGDFEPSQLFGGMAPPHPTLFIRRSVYNRVGPYRLDMRCAADFEYWVRLFNNKSLKYKYLPMIMAEMSTGGQSTSPMSRLLFNNFEKLAAFRHNNLPANPLKLAYKYFVVFKNIFVSPKYGK